MNPATPGRPNDNLDTLRELLDLIEGKVFPFSKGITTYVGRDENQTKLHEALLKLESIGKVRRHYEKDDYVLWMPEE